MKKIYLFLALISVILPINAQRQTGEKQFSKETELVTMWGNEKYSFIVDENGKHIYDGPFSIKCNLPKRIIEVNYYESFTASGSYSLTTNYVKGKLNGAFNISYKFTLLNAPAGYSDNYTYSCTFKNGVPNGALRMSGKSRNVSVTYKNGKLVGPFSYKSNTGYVWTGTLTQTGLPTGTWTYEDAPDSHVMKFDNGVLISLTKDGKTTKPALQELATKYARKQITKEELLAQNVIIKTSMLKIGDKLESLFGYVTDDEVDGYDYSIDANVEYELLEGLPFFTEEGYKILLDELNYLLDEDSYESKFIDLEKAKFLSKSSLYPSKEYPGLYETTICYSRSCNEMGICAYEVNMYNPIVYLTEAQTEGLKQKVAEINKILDEKKLKYIKENAISYFSNVKRYDHSSIVVAINESDLNNPEFIKKQKELLRDSYMKDLQCIKAIKEKFTTAEKNAKQNLRKYSKDTTYYVDKRGSYYDSGVTYVDSRTENEYTKYIEILDKKIAELEEIERQELLAKKEAAKQKIADEIKPKLDYLLNKKSSRIVANIISTESYNGHHDSYTGYSQSLIEESKTLFPFVSYKIIGVEENASYDATITCIFEKVQKKVGTTYYKIEFNYRISKINLSSFNVNDAQVVTLESFADKKTY